MCLFEGTSSRLVTSVFVACMWGFIVGGFYSLFLSLQLSTTGKCMRLCLLFGQRHVGMACSGSSHLKMSHLEDNLHFIYKM